LQLYEGADKEKDQSYFLWTLTQDQLAHTLFPVGHLQKSEVRALAKEFRLPNAEKKDSQGLCFMGTVDMAEFLKHYLNTKEGNVLDGAGNIIGTHDGAMLYTLGQRHGFRTTRQGADPAPLYVVSKDIDANTITVGERVVGIVMSDTARISLTGVNDIHLCTGEVACDARIRYRGMRYTVEVSLSQNGAGTASFPHIDEFIASGQSIVFYRGDECLGGATIA
jgi:tRNA-specific 2-thiouridylase